jgi:hypothetical protein
VQIGAPSDPETAAAPREFPLWAISLWAISLTGGNAPKYLDVVGFIPLQISSAG